MAGTDPLTGTSYPTSGDAPAVYQHIQAAVFGLSENTIPYFATTTARNTAYTNFVSAGGTMRDGMLSYCADEDMVRVYESGTWRFFKYAGAASATNTPQTHIKRIAISVPNNTSTTITGWTIDRAHASCTVNTSTGVATINERGVWAISGRFASDYTNRGASAVTMVISTAPYALENTQTRNVGWPSAGTLRQPLSYTGYLDPGATITWAAFQSNDSAAANGYDATFVISLIG